MNHHKTIRRRRFVIALIWVYAKPSDVGHSDSLIPIHVLLRHTWILRLIFTQMWQSLSWQCWRKSMRLRMGVTTQSIHYSDDGQGLSISEFKRPSNHIFMIYNTWEWMSIKSHTSPLQWTLFLPSSLWGCDCTSSSISVLSLIFPSYIIVLLVNFDVSTCFITESADELTSTWKFDMKNALKLNVNKTVEAFLTLKLKK